MHIKAIIFPGAHFSVYQDETHDWIRQLKEFAKMVFYDFPHIKMVGICFGHQLISATLGGKVERMVSYLESVKLPLFQGKEKITLKDPA